MQCLMPYDGGALISAPLLLFHRKDLSAIKHESI